MFLLSLVKQQPEEVTYVYFLLFFFPFIFGLLAACASQEIHYVLSGGFAKPFLKSIQEVMTLSLLCSHWGEERLEAGRVDTLELSRG